MAYENRIISYGVKRASEFQPNESNWRTHPEKQKTALAAALGELGWIDVVIENRQTGRLVDGHERVEQALAAGDQDVPYLLVDLSEEEEKLALTVLDPITMLAGMNAEVLSDLIAQIETESEVLQSMLSELDSYAHAQILRQSVSDLDAIPRLEEADELREKWQVESGQLWRLPSLRGVDHRLICGDCTDPDIVLRLLSGARPLLMVTDPPYGVNYDAAWRDGLSTFNRRRGKVENDDRVDWRAAWKLFPGDVIYQWSAAGDPIITSGLALQESGFAIRNMLIWRKPHFPLGRGHYTYQHEPCWYAVRRGAKAHWIGDMSETSVWEVALDPNIPGGHSTQKPVELFSRPIRNHSGDVYEPFAGSGSTIIAAENCARISYSVELLPQYVAVILQRFQDATGECPELLTE